MRHAIRRLREELRQIEETAELLDGDPSTAGNLAQAMALGLELQVEIAEVRAALATLEAAEAVRARPRTPPEAPASIRTPRGRRLAPTELAA